MVEKEKRDIHMRKQLIQGFFMNIQYYAPTAKDANKGGGKIGGKKGMGGDYLDITNLTEMSRHPGSLLSDNAEWVVYDEIVQTGKNYMRTVTRVRPEWLSEVVPSYFGKGGAFWSKRGDGGKASAARRHLEKIVWGEV